MLFATDYIYLLVNYNNATIKKIAEQVRIKFKNQKGEQQQRHSFYNLIVMNDLTESLECTTYLKNALNVLSLQVVPLCTLFNTMRVTDQLQQFLCLHV